MKTKIVDEKYKLIENEFLDIWCDYCNDYRDVNPNGLPHYYLTFSHYMKKKNRKFIGEYTEIETNPYDFFENKLDSKLQLVIYKYTNSVWLEFKDKYSLLSIIRFIISKVDIKNITNDTKKLIQSLFDKMYTDTLSKNHHYDEYPHTLFEYFTKTKDIKKFLNDTQKEIIVKYNKENIDL